MATFADSSPNVINFIFPDFKLVKFIEDADLSVNTYISPLSLFLRNETPRLTPSSRFVPVSVGIKSLIALFNLALSSEKLLTTLE